MNIVFSHETALGYWRTAQASLPIRSDRSLMGDQMLLAQDRKARAKKQCAHVERFNSASLPALQIAKAKVSFSRWKKPSPDQVRGAAASWADDSQALHVLCPSPESMLRAQGVVSHVDRKIAKNAQAQFVRISAAGDGVHAFVTSPEACFVQMAGKAGFIKAVALGYELCGTYRLQREAALTGCCPLASAASLARFTERCATRPGVKAARQAVRYVVNGSASPMETAVSMLLCLPKRYGGYGLPAARMNHPIDTAQKHFGSTVGNHRFCDLYWPDQKVALEYDSSLWHSQAADIARDANRRVELAHMGVTTITLTKRQLLSLTQMDAAADLLFKMLGRRFQKPGAQWRQRQSELRRALLSF